MTMNTLRAQLLQKLIPYISKKQLNDALCELVLKQMPFEFYENIYHTVVRHINRHCIVKGGAAIEIHLNNKKDMKLHDLDLQIHMSFDETTNHSKIHVSLDMIKNDLNKLTEQYNDIIVSILDSVQFPLECFHSEDDCNRNCVVFKSYKNEAISFNPSTVRFVLNPKKFFNMTCSSVNDNEYDLVRFSYNVHMVDDINKIYWYTDLNEVKTIKYFPLDLYYLDISVHQKCALGSYKIARCFNTNVFVDHVDYIVSDQLECIMYNVFYQQINKAMDRMKRVKKLLQTCGEQVPDENRTRVFNKIIESSENVKFTINDVKKFMYALGPRLGARLVILLYFKQRFYNRIEHITYQVNFPYDKIDPHYFSNCWKIYLSMLNEIFTLKFFIK